MMKLSEVARELSQARADGRLPNDNAVLSATRATYRGGPADGTRFIDLRAWQGVELRILPDRGFDIGAAWYGGHPLAWVSQIGETGPLRELSDLRWSHGFGGGLMVTCGLRNVGMPSEGHGLHGTFSHLSASDIDVERTIGDNEALITATGLITDSSEPAPLEVERSIRTYAGLGRVELTDRTTNRGTVPVDAPLLYHFNFGYPFWGPGARLSIETSRTAARDPASEQLVDAWQLPPDVEAKDEHVLEHDVVANDGWGHATISNSILGLQLTLGWRVAELPRFHQWVDASPGMYVLGLEPANCSTLGRAHDRAEGRLPRLEPGEVRETAVRVEAGLL